ncbi:MAG: hypothetical protein IJU69_04945, partial [Bacteroidales bacterium]|nr:hypothetical protein [Bacteroidales bacterium]
MKHLHYLTLAAIVAMGLASCQQEAPLSAPSQSTPGQLSLSATVDDAGSKTYINSSRTILWSEGEFLKLWYNDGKDNFATSDGSSASAYKDQPTAVFNFTVTPAAASQYTFGAVYPAGSVIEVGGVDNTDPTKYKVNLNSAQKSAGGAYDPAAYILMMQPQTASSVSSQISGKFRRAAALNRFSIIGAKEEIVGVEVIAKGFGLSGKRYMNLTDGTSGEIYEPSESVTVTFDTPMPAGNFDVWFTSWGVSAGSNEVLTVRLLGKNENYSKNILLGASGLKLQEGMMNLISIDFSSVNPDVTTLRDFALSFTDILDVWNSTTGNVSVATGGDPKVFKNVKYVPQDTKINVGGISLNKSNMYDIALQGLQALNAGGKLSDKLPAPRSFSWGDNPYNELEANGGDFQNSTVDFNFLLNFASRELGWAADPSRLKWSNFCWYTDKDGKVSTAGTPQVTQYKGVCCLERNLLIMARFYKYLLDNNINEGVASACASMALNAGLYDEAQASAPETPTESATIKDFAKAFAGVLTVWDKTSSTTVKVGDVTMKGKYVPANTTISVGGKTYTKTQTLDIALQALQSLMSGGNTSAAMPTPRAYTWSSNPYLESTEFGNSTVTVQFLQNAASRQLTFAATNGVWANYCSYGSGEATSSGTPSVSGFKGVCCLERVFLIAARVFKYINDNNVTSGVPTALSDKTFDATLFGTSSSTTEPTTPTTTYTNPYTQKGIHTNQGAGYLGQKTGYTCGPHSIMQCIYKMTGKDLSEMTIASWAGTTSD